VKRSVEVAVIGGGVIGCAIAYNLARLGLTDVAVYERSYLSSGSTGRCGAGVRAQWGTEMNCRLAHASLRYFEQLEDELDYPDIEFKQGGYLILAFGDAQLAQFARNVALQNGLGIPSRLITPDQAREIVPHLGAPDLVGATFSPTDGHCNPFKVTDAYALAAQRLGVEINSHTTVTGLEMQDGRVQAVETDRGKVNCRVLVNAAGPWAEEVGRMAGLDLPLYTQRHQILVSEPVRPMQRPMVISFSHGLYCQQVPHGSFIMGLGDALEPKGHDIGHSWQFMSDIARRIEHLLPPLARLRVVRQWSGLYTMTPDAQPILGQAMPVENLFQAVGFSGHGFMLAPVVGRVIAQQIAGHPAEVSIAALDIGRFERGELVREPSVV
jgi:sarcosine oxidase subunit beta